MRPQVIKYTISIKTNFENFFPFGMSLNYDPEDDFDNLYFQTVKLAPQKYAKQLIPR
jgi:hypothetical protein